jgi:NADPH2:quinone reductase
MAYTAKREDLLATAADLFAVIRSGAVRVRIDATYPLREAAAAHVALEARRTTGSTVLLP